MEQAELLTAIKSIASDGADLTAITEGLKAYGVKPIDSVIDKETAIKFMRDNPHLNSAFDSGISKGVESYKTRFTAEDLPGLISAERQKVISELNPEETKADKLAREFEEYKLGVDKEKAVDKLGKELITTFDTIKAGDNGFKAEDLQHFVNMGEKGVEQFVKLNERIAEITKLKIEEALKGKFNTGDPGAGDPPSTYDFQAEMAKKGYLNQ